MHSDCVLYGMKLGRDRRRRHVGSASGGTRVEYQGTDYRKALLRSRRTERWKGLNSFRNTLSLMRRLSHIYGSDWFGVSIQCQEYRGLPDTSLGLAQPRISPNLIQNLPARAARGNF